MRAHAVDDPGRAVNAESPAPPLRWGILGTADVNRSFVPAVRKARGAELVAIASRSASRAREFAEKHAIARAHGDYAALIDDPGIDAVYVALPNALHAEWTARAAAAKKHVLCEKPLATREADARAMLEACRAAGVHLEEHYPWREHPRTRALAVALAEGELGHIQTASSAFTTPFEPPPGNIRLQPALGGGVLWDLGCYIAGGFHWLFGAAPRRASCTAAWRDGVDVRAAGWMDFGEGRAAIFDCGFGSPYRAHLEVVGDGGRAYVDNLWFPGGPTAYGIHRAGRAPEARRFDAVDQASVALENFSRRAHAGECDGRTTAAPAVLRVVEALAVSAREGRAVAIADDP